MKLLQVCNVGNICGGTAACAWTIARALPGWEHAIRCLSPVTPETIQAFAPWGIERVDQVDGKLLERLQPDVVLLHNVGRGVLPNSRSCLVVQYHHSAGPRLAADRHVACSRWLADQLGSHVDVLYQPVPIPVAGNDRDPRCLDDELIVGRICTPTPRKWPKETIPFYASLSAGFPGYRWEFVGAPEEMRPRLLEACRGRAVFHAANWQARSHLRRWHLLLYHHPSLAESFGRTVAEAMRAGCLPIVDDRGGFREQIISGRSGFLCGNLNEFAQALETLASPEIRWRMARQARELADEKFSLRTFARNFQWLLSSSPPE